LLNPSWTRLRAAWWVLVVWWLVLPELARDWRSSTGSAPGSRPPGLLVGLGLLAVVIRARRQFTGRRVPGSQRAVAVLAVVYSVVLLYGSRSGPPHHGVRRVRAGGPCST